MLLIAPYLKKLLNSNESKTTREQIGMSFDLELSCFAAKMLILNEG